MTSETTVSGFNNNHTRKQQPSQQQAKAQEREQSSGSTQPERRQHRHHNESLWRDTSSKITPPVTKADVRAPKVPRPSNAFFLFRQHHQSEVRSENPDLRNPDISKVLGRMWKALTEEEWNVWKQAAEEEKIRHRQRYPDYQYRPRPARKRGARGGGRSRLLPFGKGSAGYDKNRGAGTSDSGKSHGEDKGQHRNQGSRYHAPLPSVRSILGFAGTT